MAHRAPLKFVLVGFTALTCAAIAWAQEGPIRSPFAKKNHTPQAWEAGPDTSSPSAQPHGEKPVPQTYTAPTYSAPTYGNYIPSQIPTTQTAPMTRSASDPYATPQSVPTSISGSVSRSASGSNSNPAHQTSSSNLGEPSLAGGYYTPQSSKSAPMANQTTGQASPYTRYSNPPSRPASSSSTYSSANPYPYNQQTQYNNNSHYQGQQAQTQNAPIYAQKSKSWTERLGLRNVLTSLSGYLKLGTAATDHDGDWKADFIADGSVRGEVSAMTSGGLEYGAGLRLRGQYDKYRRGFGGRVGDCPPTQAGCASTLLAGTPVSVRGHTSRFYTSGPDIAKESEIALEGAYLFLRSAYGDFTLGRDDGAAYLFSLGAPSLLAVSASNSPVDYTGLDAVKTINDASGFAEKISYISPRLLGDQVGVGVQLGLSYAPDARACGVDYCVRANGKDGSGALSPDLENVLEAGLALDRKFKNGLSVEATATYATASESSNIAIFEDLQAYGLGLELGYDDITLGTSWLQSNNGVIGGDYSAWDIGATWQPSKFGFTLGYGHAKDKTIVLTSDQITAGLTYDWRENYRFGVGVQHINREVPFTIGGNVTPRDEQATALFVEGRITF